MQSNAALWSDPPAHLKRQQPDAPVLYFAPSVLQETARAFQEGFPGLMTYAVKANSAAAVLDNLVAAGLQAFDVASPEEMAQVRAACSDAVLHYNNPVRAPGEIAAAVAFGVESYSVDDLAGLDALAPVPEGREVSVRLALPVPGAAYDFGEKFGATPDEAQALLGAVARRGFRPAMTFHPGTMCNDPGAWEVYIDACARVAGAAGVRLARLNIGGGFAVDRGGAAARRSEIFAAIRARVGKAFGAAAPALVAEPGRAMVADAFQLAARVKAVRSGDRIVLNEGIYGALAEWKDIGTSRHVTVLGPDGQARQGPARARVVYGPTCDSLDRLPGTLDLPGDLQAGDVVLFSGMGAYSLALTTRFNGYGLRDVVTVASLATCGAGQQGLRG